MPKDRGYCLKIRANSCSKSVTRFMNKDYCKKKAIGIGKWNRLIIANEVSNLLYLSLQVFISNDLAETPLKALI